MRVPSLVLVITAAILFAIGNAVSVTTVSTQATLDFPSRVVESDQGDKMKRRFLRSDTTGDRALHNDPFLTVDDVFHEFGKKFYGNSLLTKLDNLMAKLEYKFWLLKKRTPEKAKTKLGLHHVPNYKDHPNYDKWIGYLRAYNKKHKIDG
ncbi:hypothetical protein PC128_g19614 [Phytophthora cactorum]|nr:hypothetical protein PC121_g10745 [Phytophthora cactorum]KAG3166913.1 hypothetical protein PC128_g19614 [Phytophthora cactorum]KAG4041853.1 hypothetical protein PC123_g22644 [Phytophthora cactorum]